MTTQTAGRFTLHRKLPAGGMGRVFEAEDTATGRRVALKLIDLGTDTDSVQIVDAERLGAELQTRLCAIDPRVTEVYESGEMPNYFFIVMEYVDGEDLSEITARQALEPKFAAKVAQDVLEVLDHAHNFVANVKGQSIRGVVHGDVKPRNIRLTASGQVKVLDFGIAKALSLTRNFTHNIFGSVQYSSPERLATGEVTVNSDLWGVAVVLYEMIAGHPYFEAQSPQKLEYTIRNYRQLHPFPAGVPDALASILQRALAADERMRYRTAAEFAQALRGFQAGLPATGQNGHFAQPVETSDATRRTSQPFGGVAETRRSPASPPVSAQQYVDATRRTNPGQKVKPLQQRSPFPAAPLARRRPSFLGSVLRTLLIAICFVILVGAFFCIREYLVWQDAGKLDRELASEKQQNLDAAWLQYAKLSSRSHLPISLWSVQSTLRDRLMSDADHTLARYGDPDAAPVTEAEWVHAHNEVAHALELEPNDKAELGKLRLIDGHLALLRGTARRDPRLIQEARQDYVDATNLIKKSPDPWLGLARLYIYSLHDIDDAEAAITQAERRGHDIGKRETAELADGYRYRAERSIALSGHAASKADADRYNEMAENDLIHARRLYQSILPWGGSVASMKKVDDSLHRLPGQNPSLGKY